MLYADAEQLYLCFQSLSTRLVQGQPEAINLGLNKKIISGNRDKNK